jgi:hypothetical protein
VQFAAVLACDGLKAGGNVLEAIIELTDFDQLGLAELAALRQLNVSIQWGPVMRQLCAIIAGAV